MTVGSTTKVGPGSYDALGVALTWIKIEKIRNSVLQVATEYTGAT